MATLPVFYWEPLNLSQGWMEEMQWSTYRTEMESGLVRTRKKWAKPRRTARPVTFAWLDSNEADTLEQFFYDNIGTSFWMPSWGRETIVSSDSPATAKNLYVEVATPFFVSSPGSHGNYIYAMNVSSQYEIIQVSSVVSHTPGHVLAVDNLLYTYAANQYIHKAYKSIFADDRFRKKRVGYHIYEVELTIMEMGE